MLQKYIVGLFKLHFVLESLYAHCMFHKQANRDVTRMEIFMSLVRLLEQTVRSGTFVNALDNNNVMVHHSFPQATSIAATGRPSSLQ